MRPRLAAASAALLLLMVAPGSAAAARPTVEFIPGTLTVFDAGCADYFAILDLSWTGATANGATQLTGTYTTFGTLDQVTDDSTRYGWRPPQHDGTMSVVFSGPFDPDDHIGALVTLTMGGMPLEAAGRPVATGFVDGGSCVSS